MRCREVQLACAWAVCSPSPGRGRYGGTCARAYCRPGCLAPGSRRARSSDTRSRMETWPDALHCRQPPQPLPPALVREPPVPPACQLWLLLSAQLPGLYNMYIYV